jgi:insertion element IS1 protein InsB
LKLWENIKEFAIGVVYADYWKAYNEFVPEDQLVQTKAETFTVEGYNSLFRHFLARLRRKTKCYTKAKYMLIHSVKLLMFKWNNDLAILY